MTRLPRRAALAALALLGLGARARAAVPTPPQTEGPFYPEGADRLPDDDWDLVKIEGAVREAGGQVLHLSGRVLDRAGATVAEVPVEIWQCDANGRYRHQGDRGGAPRDAGFQGFGRVVTDAEGRWRFRTIVPVAYPGRTPHIHARIGRPDGSALVTQVYVAGEALNARDFIFRSLGAAGQKAVSMELVARADGDAEASIDLVI